MNKKTKPSERTVIFEITTQRALPVGQQVFVSGDQPMLGDWRPDGLPLTRMDELTWAASAIVPGDRPFAFKVTRGTWETEATEADGSLPPNHEVDPAARPRIAVTVPRWRDEIL